MRGFRKIRPSFFRRRLHEARPVSKEVRAINEFFSVIPAEGWEAIKRMAKEPGMTMELLWKKITQEPAFSEVVERWRAGFGETDREALKDSLAQLPLDWTKPYQNNLIRNFILPKFKDEQGINIPLTGRGRGVQITRPSRLVKQAIEDLDKNLEYQSMLLSQSVDSQLDQLKAALRMLALNLDSPRRMLVYGTSGVGKTYTVTTYLDYLQEMKDSGEIRQKIYPEYHLLRGDVLSSEVVVDPETGERKKLSGRAKLRDVFVRHSTRNSPILIADDIDLNEGNGQIRSFLLSVLETNVNVGGRIPMGTNAQGKLYFREYDGRLILITNRSNFDEAIAQRFQLKFLIQSRSSEVVQRSQHQYRDEYEDQIGPSLYAEIFRMLSDMAPGLLLTNRNIESILSYAAGLVKMREKQLTDEDTELTDDVILDFVHRLALNAARGDFARPEN